MNKVLFIVLSFFTLVSCQQTKETTTKETTATKDTLAKKTFDMYEMSEMALLMEQMYVDNQRLKARLEKGEPAGEFPSHFAKIHSAIMTDPTENDDFFKKQAKVFLEAQKLIYKEGGFGKILRLILVNAQLMSLIYLIVFSLFRFQVKNYLSISTFIFFSSV